MFYFKQLHVVLLFLDRTRNTKVLVASVASISLTKELLLYSPPPSLSQFGIFTTGLQVGIRDLKYCVHNLFIAQFSRRKERSDDLGLAIWVPKHSKLNPLNCTGPPLLPIKAWQEWGMEWYILRLRGLCSQRSGEPQKCVSYLEVSGMISHLGVPCHE